MQVTDLYIYPIKSCRGIQLSQAEVTPKGLLWDREMMLVDGKGKFITQREYPQLATVSVTITGAVLRDDWGGREFFVVSHCRAQKMAGFMMEVGFIKKVPDLTTILEPKFVKSLANQDKKS